MSELDLDAVTGAFGYTGKYITRLLLAQGREVLTLTGHPDRPNPFGHRIRAVPFNFDQPSQLTRSLRGVATLYNTYWVRFAHGPVSFDTAVENSRTLIRCAEEAGVRRIVHLSILHAATESPFPYFRGKGLVEAAIRASKLSYTILRPAVIFGTEDILINNIAWLLRKFPIFVIPGSGNYRVRPIYVEDLAELAVGAGAREDNITLDAMGPETYTYLDLVRRIARTVGSRSTLVHLPPDLVLPLAQLVGQLVQDVVLTEEEIEGLRANLLVTEGPATGHTRLSEWLAENQTTVGARYASELARHYR